jgi:hypothetical protein
MRAIADLLFNDRPPAPDIPPYSTGNIEEPKKPFFLVEIDA